MPSTVGAPLRLGVIIAYRLDNRPSYADLPMYVKVFRRALTLPIRRGSGGAAIPTATPMNAARTIIPRHRTKEAKYGKLRAERKNG